MRKIRLLLESIPKRSHVRTLLAICAVSAVTIAFGVGPSGHTPVKTGPDEKSGAMTTTASISLSEYSGGRLMAADPNGGYWTTTWLGAITSHDSAPVFGSPALSGIHLSKSIVAMAATPDGQGYWLVASDGGVFTYGDAKFYGSAGAIHLNQPVVAMAATPDGQGYWLVASDGGVFTYGDAKFYGSAGAIHLNQPVVAMAATSDGQGYWLVASDGGIFTYGDAKFYGSAGAIHLNQPVVAMAATSDGQGYWLVASDGGIFTYGDAKFYGTLGSNGSGALGIIISPPTPGYTLIEDNGTAAVLSVAPVGSASTPTGNPASAPTSTTPTTSTTTAPTTTATAPGTTGPTPGTPGMDFGGDEASVYDSSYAQQLATFAQVKADGAQWIRWTMPMNDGEPESGQFNWYETQELQAAVASGLKVDALLTNSPSWAATADGSPSPTAFAAFAKAAVEEYAPLGVTTYEIWNEENVTQAWGEAFTPAEYTALLQASYTAIKGADPTAEVLVGGFSPAPDSGGASYAPVTFLTDMYADGAQGSFDAVADHPYSYPDLPDQTDSWNPFTYLPTLHQIMADNGDGSKQIWLTEYGAPTTGTGAVTPAFQAESITGAFQWVKQYSWIGPLFIFDYEESTDDTYGDFGIFNADGTPTQAGTAFSTAALSYG